MSLRPAPCIAFSLPGSSGAGALVKLNLATRFGFFFAYSSIASCVSARLPATSTTLIVTGLFGIGSPCARAAGNDAESRERRGGNAGHCGLHAPRRRMSFVVRSFVLMNHLQVVQARASADASPCSIRFATRVG